jgi:NADH:ubiquinone oxidoreductase subunit D
MTKALNKRIADAFGAIYDMGDSGLDYMDRHEALDEALMEHFYNDTVETLSKADKTKMADMLETIASDMEFDLESF